MHGKYPALFLKIDTYSEMDLKILTFQPDIYSRRPHLPGYNFQKFIKCNRQNALIILLLLRYIL